jgi:CrcB protein
MSGLNIEFSNCKTVLPLRESDPWGNLKIKVISIDRGTCIMTQLLWISVGGALGALGRYGVSGFVQNRTGAAFPWGTLAANLLGCFIFGLAWTLAEKHLPVGGHARMAIFVGFLGAFTTFSTFAFESEALMRDAEWMLFMGNVALQNFGGIALIIIGMKIGKFI